MPLSINVGLSRKASKDYQSSGASINIVAELDQSLLAKPDELQRQIDGLYQQAEEAINRNAAASPPTPTPASPPARSNGRVDRRPNGSGNGHGNGRANAGGMTDSQRRDLTADWRRSGPGSPRHPWPGAAHPGRPPGLGTDRPPHVHRANRQRASLTHPPHTPPRRRST